MLARALFVRRFCSSGAAAAAPQVTSDPDPGQIQLQGLSRPIQATELLSKRDRRELFPKYRQGPARRLMNLLESHQDFLTRPQIWALTNKADHPEDGIFETKTQLSDVMRWMQRHNWVTTSVNPRNRKHNRVWIAVPKPKRNVAPAWAISMDQVEDAEAEARQNLVRNQQEWKAHKQRLDQRKADIRAARSKQ